MLYTRISSLIRVLSIAAAIGAIVSAVILVATGSSQPAIGCARLSLALLAVARRQQEELRRAPPVHDHAHPTTAAAREQEAHASRAHEEAAPREHKRLAEERRQ